MSPSPEPDIGHESSTIRQRLVGAVSPNLGGAVVSQLMAVLSGLAGFYVLGNRFGPEGYGIYAAALSLANILGPLAQFGTTHLAVHQRSRTGDATGPWRMTIGTQLAGGLSLALVLALLQPVVSPAATRPFIFILVAAEVAFVGLVGAAVVMAESSGRSETGARIKTLFVMVRVFALAGFWISGSTELFTWVVLHAGSGIGGFIGAMVILRRRLGISAGLSLVRRRDILLGTSFAAGQVALSAQNDADKAILAFNRLETDAGIYAAGYRVAAMAELPINALVASTYGQFFDVGSTSIDAARRLARRTTLASLAFSIPMAIALIVAAPLLPLVFSEFEDSVTVVRLLALVLPLKGVQSFAGNALAGSDQQAMRLRVMIVASVFNVAANFVLIPRYNINGAIGSTIVTEIGISIALWTILSRLSRAEQDGVDRNRFS